MKLFAFFFTLLVSLSVFGGKEHFSSRISGSEIVLNKSFRVVDDKYFDMLENPSGWSSRFTNYRVSNKVMVGLNPAIKQQTAFSGEIAIEVIYEVWNTATLAFDEVTENRTLFVEYNTNEYQEITDRSSFVFQNAHRMKVKIKGLTGVLAEAIFIEGHVEVERYYTGANDIVNHLKATAYPAPYSFSQPENEFIDLSWDFYPGAESYELEYVHVNDYTLVEGTYKHVNQIPFDYYRNSTRVELLTNYYRIPNIYDHGYFIFRVRPIMRGGNDFSVKKYETAYWSAPESGLIGWDHPSGEVVFIGREYDPGMNWSHEVSFTEEGKRFEAVAFGDGLGRGRQTVARNTETEQTVVSNVYFDELGRVVIADLPTPLDVSYPVHHPNFNRADVAGNPSFNNQNFDNPNGSDGTCNFNPYGMSDQYGSSRYYSPQNPNKQGPNSMIPDAENFPYSRIHYLEDFTGRVDLTSAAGPELTLGKGREMKYYYVTATQPELYQLFGEEAGDASHYQKLTTVDQNGQVYVQYTDMAGRVVASYMMGPSPSNLDELEDTASEELTVPMLTNGSGQIPDYVAMSSTLTYTQYFAETSEVYAMEYTFTPQQYESICTISPVCFDCMYELKLKVQEQCGTVLYEFSDTINGYELDELCNGETDYKRTFELTIPKGNYTFTKTLSVSQEAINDYWCMYIDNITDECLPPVASLFNELYAKETFPECDDEEYLTEYDTAEDCELTKLLMAADITPGGQYARYSVHAGVYSATDPTSVFYGSTPAYTTFNFGTIQVLDPVTNTLVSPSALSMKNYIQLFDPSWASYLIENEPAAHPESCMLGFCDACEASYAYNQGMLATYSFDDAISYNATTQTGGYFLPINFSASPTTGSVAFYFGNNFSNCDVHEDPFFASGGPGAAYRSTFENKLHEYKDLGSPALPCVLSIWEYAVLTAHMEAHPETNIGIMNCGEIRTLVRSSKDDCMKDLIWVNYRRFYLELKQTYVYMAQAAYAAANCASMPEIGTGSGPYSGKWPHFPGINFVNQVLNDATDSYGGGSIDFSNPSSAADVQDVVNSASAQGCETACDTYAEEWLERLSGCNIQPAHRAALFSSFKALCMNGCDDAHPGGASTPNPNSTYTDANTGITNPTIRQLLNHYGYSESMLCTELLIDQPLPYENGQLLIEHTTVPLDDCVCDKVLRAYYDLPGSGLSYPEEVLEAQTGIALEDIDYIACECNEVVDNMAAGSWQPGYEWPSWAAASLAATNIKVHPSLACPESQGCADCESVKAPTEELLQRFGYTSASTLKENYELFLSAPTAYSILTNYLNQELGFLKEYDDYADFIGGCFASASDPYCTPNPQFNELSAILKLLSFRGQLLSTTLDLVQENIVYANSSLYEEGVLGRYFSGSVAGTTLTMDFSTGSSSSCKVRFSLPEGAVFGFEDIVSFGVVVPKQAECGVNDVFSVEVSYLSCGVLQTEFLEGSADCFTTSLCVCGDNGQLLCNDRDNTISRVCYQPTLDELYMASLELYQEQIGDLYTTFKQEYNATCSEAFRTENYSYTGPARIYQYTLFYYDQAGNLVKTVAPEGIRKVAGQDELIRTTQEQVSGPGDASVPSVLRNHEYVTGYRYNSYNQPVATSNPDQDGETRFWYDRYGRIVASQNPVQKEADLYSYTFYDAAGRPVEVGQVRQITALTESILKSDDLGAAFGFWVAAGARSEITRTFYDEPMNPGIPALFEGGVQAYLRLRVASVAYYDVHDSLMNYVSATHYSYDIHGNVKEQIQDVPLLAPVEQDKKSTRYEYELISGNVTEVAYQKDKRDEIAHRYHYDALNRLVEVETSTDRVHYDRQAHYRYYDYGPLARIEYGQNQVQGQDFFYTINGWLKGMNASVFHRSKDAGKDASTGYFAANTKVHNLFARDVTGHVLGYYEGDYKAISAAVVEIHSAGSAFNADARNLYNGNIRSLMTALVDRPAMGKTFHYDQLQRLTQMQAYYYEENDNFSWNGIAASSDYFNSYSYDKNGNIRTLQRNGRAVSGLLMDNLNYQYVGLDGLPNASSTRKSNRLNYVSDNAAHDAQNVGDIKAGMQPDNYVYDRLGQLIRDHSEGIAAIEWRYGDKKMKKITRNDADSPQLEFVYNPMGQRVLKITKPRSNNTIRPEQEWLYTYYSYDANGQVMAVYDVKMSTGNNVAYLSEQHVYGASRLGMVKQGKTVYSNGNEPFQPLVIRHWEGQTYYELSNYLGNVEAVITDRKTWITTEVNYRVAVVRRADYYPFGMSMPGRDRDYVANDYRFGYNGMEADKEVKGSGNSYTTEFRQYDPRLGRWLSLDPLMAKYPWMSPYVAFNNNPIFFVDPLGLEGGPAKEKINLPEIETGGEKVKDLPEFTVTAFRRGNASPEFIKWLEGIGTEGLASLKNELYEAKKKAFDVGLSRAYYGKDALGRAKVPSEIQARYRAEADKEAMPILRAMWAESASGFKRNSLNPISRAGYKRKLAQTVRTQEEGWELITDVGMEVGIAWLTRFTLKAKVPVSSSSTAAKGGFSVNPSKFDYFFGRVVSGSEHNIARSAQNLKDLTTLGIKNESQLMKVFGQALENGTVISTKTSQYGTTVIRSVNIGNQGSVNVGFFYQGGNMTATPSVSTIIPKIFK